MDISDEDDLKAELESLPDREIPGTREWILRVWWIIKDVRCAHAKYDQTRAAQFALYRAMQKQNLN